MNILTENPKKQVTIPKEIDEVKNALQLLIDKGKSTYNLKEKNELFNTYRFSLLDGLTVIIISCSIEKIGDNKTSISIETTRPIGGNATKEQLQSSLDNFLTLLSKILSGEEIDEKVIEKTSNTSSTTTFVMILIIIIIAIYIFTR